MPLLKGEARKPKVGDVVLYTDEYLGNVDDFAMLLTQYKPAQENDMHVTGQVFYPDGTSMMQGNVNFGIGAGTWHWND